jgi:hypothetical protein
MSTRTQNLVSMLCVIAVPLAVVGTMLHAPYDQFGKILLICVGVVAFVIIFRRRLARARAERLLDNQKPQFDTFTELKSAAQYGNKPLSHYSYLGHEELFWRAITQSTVGAIEKLGELEIEMRDRVIGNTAGHETLILRNKREFGRFFSSSMMNKENVWRAKESHYDLAVKLFEQVQIASQLHDQAKRQHERYVRSILESHYARPGEKVRTSKLSPKPADKVVYN